MRPSWEDYFLDLAQLVGSRSTCDKGHFTGCVIVSSDNCILTTGYAGSSPGMPHCDEVGHEMVEYIYDGIKSVHCIRTTHAEANAIAQAARKGIALEGSTLYCTLEPCLNCAKLIVRAGIIKVVARFQYHRGRQTRELFNATGIKLTIKEKP
jgi:dCMP deaminase